MINYISAPFKWFFKLEAASGLVLLIGAAIALFLSNSDLSKYYFDILNTHLLIGTKNFGIDLSIFDSFNPIAKQQQTAQERFCNSNSDFP